MQFASTTSQQSGAVVVHPVGEIDRDTRDQFLAALDAAVAQAGQDAAVQVDLSGITFLDSSGIGALVTARQAALDRSVGFVVRDPQPAVRHVLDLTNVWLLLSR